MQYKFSARKKGNVWQLILAYKEGRKWRQKTRSGFKNKRDAMAYQNELLKEVQSSAKLDKSLSGITLADFTHFYLETRNDLTFNTLTTYRAVMKSMKELNGLPMKDISYLDIMKQMNDMHCSPSTKRTRAVVLKSILIAGVKYGVIASSPLDDFHRVPSIPDRKEKRLRTFTPEEVARFTGEKASKSRSAILCCICAMTGIRIGEALGLTWADIDFDAMEISVNKQFGRKRGIDDGFIYGFMPVKSKNGNRRIHMSPILMKRLTEYRSRNVLYMDGRLTNIKHAFVVNEYIRSTAPGHSVHDFRHTFATRILASGIDVGTVAALLGDTIATVEKNYLHYTEEMRKNAAASIDRLFG